jgi:hypothetical protein
MAAGELRLWTGATQAKVADVIGAIYVEEDACSQARSEQVDDVDGNPGELESVCVS